MLLLLRLLLCFHMNSPPESTVVIVSGHSYCVIAAMQIATESFVPDELRVGSAPDLSRRALKNALRYRPRVRNTCTMVLGTPY